jgi:hypothetical protein
MIGTNVSYEFRIWPINRWNSDAVDLRNPYLYMMSAPGIRSPDM